MSVAACVWLPENLSAGIDSSLPKDETIGRILSPPTPQMDGTATKSWKSYDAAVG